jgi:hypothetical protein
MLRRISRQQSSMLFIFIVSILYIQPHLQPQHPLISYVDAYPNGAGSCIGGMAAVGGYHLEKNDPNTGDSRSVLFGALSDGQVTVVISSKDTNDITLVENEQSTFQTQTDYSITVVTTRDPGYKGILIRFSNADNTIDVPNDIILVPIDDSLLQLASECTSETNAIGITHVNNIEKLSVSSSMYFNAPGQVTIDVTIVGVNDNVASVYGYTGYTIQIEGDAATDAPTVSPTNKPTLPPGETATPTIAPTINDFLIDTLSPTYTINKQESPATNDSSASGTLSPFYSLTKCTSVIVSTVLCFVSMFVVTFV